VGQTFLSVIPVGQTFLSVTISIRAASAIMVAVCLLAAGCASLPGILEPLGGSSQSSAPVTELMTMIQFQATPDRDAIHEGLWIRVFLFDGNVKAVEADGPLTFFAYFNAPSDNPEVVADQRWDFSPEQLRAMRGESKLGTSYVVWLPLEGSGRSKTRISVVLVYTPSNGPRLIRRCEVVGRPPLSQYHHQTLPSADSRPGRRPAPDAASE
jgi:hypothetical protein